MRPKFTEQEIETIRGALLTHLNRIPTVETRKQGFFYSLGLFLTAMAMLLLPLIYISLIVFIGLSLVYHLQANSQTIIKSGGFWGITFFLVFPVIFSILVMLFLLKPLYTKEAKPMVPYKLKRSENPFLFAYVSEIARIIGAPLPREIHLNTEVNAYAAFTHGIFSVLSLKSYLSLSLGLPLIESLTLQQLTGVIAHEFGHFTQGSAMRLTYIVRSINMWLAKVVYKRDATDVILYNACHRGGMGSICYLPRLMIWLIRLFMLSLMYIGNAISCFLMRQMEFDADTCSINIIGSKIFSTSEEDMLKIAMAEKMSISLALRLYQEEGILPEQWGAFIQSNIEDVSEDALKDFKQLIEGSNTSFFDTHPSLQARVAHSDKLAMDPCFQMAQHHIIQSHFPEITDEDSGRMLIHFLMNDFDTISTKMTCELYRLQFGSGFDEKQIVSIEEMSSSKKVIINSSKVINSYFQQQFSILLPLGLPTLIPDGVDNPNLADLCNQLFQKIEEINSLKEKHQLTLNKYKEFHELRQRLYFDRVAVLSGLQIKTTQKTLINNAHSIDYINKRIMGNEKQLRIYEDDMAPFNTCLIERIMLTLEIIQIPAFSRVSDKSEAFSIIQRIWPILAGCRTLAYR